MQTFDRIALRDRAFEEIDRVLADRKPRISYQDLSLELGRNHAFLSTFKNNPDRYMLSVYDLHKLNYLYNVDDIYILKGIRYQAIKATLARLRPLIDSI